MNFPTLSVAQIEAITAAVADYIAQQRSNYVEESTALSALQKEPLCAFFPAPVLDCARFVELMPDRYITNPSFYEELKSMGFSASVLPNFRDMAAVTFQDVVVSYGTISAQTRFHELVHVVQFQKLGLHRFASKYVTGFLGGGGYDGIPLERNAYELDARFIADPARFFSVEAEVQSWITSGRF
jgi:hypothetical protein